MSEFTNNLKLLIEVIGIDGAMESIDISIGDDKLKTIDELNITIRDELSYLADSQ